MTGIVAQVIALTSFGDEFLKTGVWPTNFYPDNTAFHFCKTIDFTIIKKNFLSTKQTTIARDPKEWLLYLKSLGCIGLRLHFQQDNSLEQDHKLAGLLGGGGYWIVESVYDSGSNYWSNSWAVTDKDAEDSKIWGVTYNSYSEKKPTSATTFNLSEIKEEFAIILNDIAEFAYNQKLSNWGDIFTKARDNLFDDNSNDIKDYYKYIINSGQYSLIAKQLIFSAKIAWVFGGMGSWNDMWMDGEELEKQYNGLSAKLYQIVNRSIIAAVNQHEIAK